MDFAPPFQATGLSHQRPTLTGRLIHFFVITDIGTRPRPRGLPRSRLGSRSTDAPDASVAGEGCDLGDPELVHELPKTRISGAVQPELQPPGGGRGTGSVWAPRRNRSPARWRRGRRWSAAGGRTGWAP